MTSRIIQIDRSPAVSCPPGARAEGRPLDAIAQGGVIDRLLIPLQDLPLPTRVHGCLEKLGLERVGDVVSLTPDDLLAQRNFGRSSLRALSTMLSRLELSLEMAPEGWPPPDRSALSGERRHAIREAVRRIFIPRDGGKLEDELLQLAAPAGSPRNVSVAVRHLGWDGDGGATLESVGRGHRISRQRVLEIVKRVRRQYQSARVLPPCLERCLAAATPRLAERAAAIEERLRRTGASRSRFRVEGLLTAAETLRLPAPIEVFYLGPERVVARKGAQAYLFSILRKVRWASRRRGVVCLRDVAELIGGDPRPEDLGRILSLDPQFEWLEPSGSWFWFRPAFAGSPRKTENRLVNRIVKRLRVSGVIGIRDLRSAASRPARVFGGIPPGSVLLALCRRIPWCVVREDRIFLDVSG